MVARPILMLALVSGVAQAQAAEPTPSEQPLAGFSDQAAFLRSQDDSFQLFPRARLQIDTYVFASHAKVPNDTVSIRRAELEATGWIAGMVYFHISGDFAIRVPAAADPVSQSNLATADDYISIAPWKNLAVLQVGQYDAPFTLDNRISDSEIAFIERALTVRALAVPQVKEQGAMVWGLLPKELLYYSVGVFNGDGENFKNVDNQFDVMGRGWIAPFALTRLEALRIVTIGGSGWYGHRKKDGLPMHTQTTTGGLAFWTPKWTVGSTTNELHQDGSIKAWGLELYAPIGHKVELRAEYVDKHQQFDLVETPAPAMPPTGRGELASWAVYGFAGYWLLGDDTILGRQGLQLPTHLEHRPVSPPRHGLMIGLRAEYLHDDTTNASLLGGSSVEGTTKLRSLVLGVNYWRSKRFRATFNYVNNHFSGSSSFVTGLASPSENEFLLRLAVAL